MKVAQLATRYPPGPGGVERHVAELSAELGTRGHRVDVFTSELYREFPWQRLAPGVPRHETVRFGEVHRLRVWSLPGAAQYTFFRDLLPTLERSPPEVVHAHTYGTHQVTIAARLCRRHGTPWVLTAHYHPPWSIEGGWWRRRLRGVYDRWLASPTLANASRLIVQTREEERLLRAHGFPLPPVSVIPPGYTPLPPPPDDARAFAREFHLDGPYALFVGRLASNKGLLDLVAAFAPLARRDSGATLVLVGEDGGMAARVDAAIRQRGLDGRVRRVGHVASDVLLSAAYREARFLVLPSEYEAFGLVLLEALAQGTPVIASRVGGMPEIIDDGETGLLVPPRSPAELAAALERLWNDGDLRHRLGEAGRTTVVPRYRWPAVAASVEGIYREVVGR